MTNECQHSQLKRQCPLCEKDNEIEILNAKLHQAVKRIWASNEEVARLRLEISRIKRDLIASEAPFYKAMKRINRI